MPRTENDTWDLASSVGATATMVAAARAVASRATSPVIDDPFAEPLVRAVGVDFFTRLASGDLALTDLDPEATGGVGNMSRFADGMAARTRYFDAFFEAANTAGIRQAVILASGLDARAYRLDWPAGTVVFELDQPAVIAAKTAAMAKIGAEPTARLCTVAVDLRGYGGSDKPPRGYDGWTLAGDTAGLIRALGHTSATLIGHADGGLVCWATSMLHPRLVRSIALVSSPHPAALRRCALTRRDQSRALLPTLLSYQLPVLPERRLARHDADALEAVIRTRASAKWVASEDFSESIGHYRTAFQIPGVAHCALEYQRWAVRSQLRGEGHRFMRSMARPLGVPVLHMRCEADPYVLSAPVEHTRRYAPHGRFVSITGAGHFAHEETPDQVNGHVGRFLDQVYTS